MNDEEFFKALKIVFNVLPNLFSSDVAIGLADEEKFVSVNHAKTFKINVDVGGVVSKDELTKKTIKTVHRIGQDY